jgi:hypothetical protein
MVARLLRIWLAIPEQFTWKLAWVTSLSRLEFEVEALLKLGMAGITLTVTTA